VRVYADSSFIVRLVAAEVDSAEAVAEYRRLELPALFFLPLHALEVRNAILQRAFHERRSLPSTARHQITRIRDAALARLEKLLARRSLMTVAVDMDDVATRAIQLSALHTERMGARAIDILHVASALTLQSEIFLTSDARQAQLAKAEGLKVVATAGSGSEKV
jgi:predicted nucleic acid-binding protein